MTWRRFRILLAGLSLDSRWHCALRADADAPVVLDDPAAAEAHFKAIV